MARVANPAIIIGLGGTGKWVVTYVKKNLLETYGGQIPENVKLLSFDTTSKQGSKDGVAEEEDILVGEVQLDDGREFIALNGNIYELCREIRDGQHPHIGSWLQAAEYLRSTETDAFDISRGAGQKRPFGRMAVFYDLQQSVQSRLMNALQTAITDVINANRQAKTTVVVYIIASLAGGTGSGMFIDVAHLARMFIKQSLGTNEGYTLRGFIALHNTFNAVIRTSQIQPNAFAAMRELDRFMLVFDQEYPIVYNPTNPTLNTIYGGKLGKLFDNCFLLDASRENLPLDGVSPVLGVFPSVADCITTMLDGRTGEAYEQHYKNVNTRISEAQTKTGLPMYSSLGTYKMILPVEDIITSLTYRAAMEALKTYLLDADQRVDQFGQVQSVLRYDGNPQQDAAELLRSPRSLSGVESTNFIQRLPGSVDNRNTKDEAYIGETAQLEAPELLTWIIPPETDRDVAELARKVREELELRLINKVPLSTTEGDDTVAGCDRIIRGVRRFRDDYLGRESNGRRIGGIYRTVLEQCMEIHKRRYQIILEEHLQRLLNGSDPTNITYQAEKRGKLGKAQSLLAKLALYFAEYNEFIERVQRRRTESDELRSAQENAGLARSDMEANKDKRGLIGVFLPGQQPAIKSQEAYLAAEQSVVDIEINDLFFAFLRQTSEELRKVTEQYKADVDGWVNTLIQGFTGNLHDPGLYRYLADRAAAHQAEREEKKRIVVHQYVTDADYEDALYQVRMKGKFEEILAELIWRFERQGEQIQLGLSGCVVGTSGKYAGRTPTERNAEFFINLSQRYFTPLRSELKLADRLSEFAPERLARELLEKCSPLIRFDSLKTGGAQERHNFVCVDEDRQKEFFDTFRTSLRLMGGAAKDNQILGSANPYTCTILATDDVIPSVGLNTYTTAETEYNKFTGNPRLLHVFPAEVNVVSYEQQLPQIRETRRRFSQKLTAMMEDVEMVQRFIRCYLYKFIRQVRGSRAQVNLWRLRVTALKQQRRSVSEFDLTPESTQPSLFQAMETFVFRRSDYVNREAKIDFAVIDAELERYEDLISGGDENRLINHLEVLLDTDVEPMRTGKDHEQAVRDLGSLMRLMVDEYIGGLEARLKTSGRMRDPDIQPLLDNVAIFDPKPMAPVAAPPIPNPDPVPSPSNNEDGETQEPSPVHPSPAAPSRKQQLAEAKELLELGEITQEEYEQMRKAILGLK